MKKGATVETWNGSHGTVIGVVGAKINVQFPDGRRFCSKEDIVSFKDPDDKVAKAKQRLAKFHNKPIEKTEVKPLEVKPNKVAMKLLTQEILNKIPPLRSQEDKGEDAIAYVKFFTPSSDWTWYATEYDPLNREFFGLVQGFEEELGYFSLDELENVKGPMGLGVERDMYFTPTPLKDLKGKTASVKTADVSQKTYYLPDGSTAKYNPELELWEYFKDGEQQGSTINLQLLTGEVISDPDSAEAKELGVSASINKRAPGKVDEPKWDEAKQAIKKSTGKTIEDFGDSEWAQVNKVYQNMGGKFKSKSSLKVANYQLNVISPEEDKENYIKVVTEQYNKRFKNQEQFEQQIDTISMDIAAELGAKYDRKGDTLVFDFSGALKDPMEVLEKQPKTPLSKAMSIMSEGLKTEGVYTPELIKKVESMIKEKAMDTKTAGHPNESFKAQYALGDIFVPSDGSDDSNQITIVGMTENAYVVEQRPIGDRKPDKDDKTYGVRFEMKFSEIEGNKELKKFAGKNADLERVSSKLEKLSEEQKPNAETPTGNKFGKLFEDVAVNIGQATELWDKINKAGAGLTFESGVSDENKKALDEDLQKLIDTLNVVVSSSKDLKSTISPTPEVESSKKTSSENRMVNLVLRAILPSITKTINQSEWVVKDKDLLNEVAEEVSAAIRGLGTTASLKIASLMKKAERLGEYEFDVHGGENWTIEAGEDGKKKIVRKHV